MQDIGILVVQTQGDMLAEMIADQVRCRSNVALAVGRVVGLEEVPRLLDELAGRIGAVVIVGGREELEAASTILLSAQPRLLVVRIAVGDDIIHMDLGSLDVHDLISAICGRFEAGGGERLRDPAGFAVIQERGEDDSDVSQLASAGPARATLGLAQEWLDAALLASLMQAARDAPGGGAGRELTDELQTNEGAEPEPDLAEAEAAAAAAWESLAAGLARAGDEDPLARLCRAFDLEPVPIQALLLSLAPELHVKYQRIFAFHNDDAARRAATLGLIGLVLGDTVGVRTALALAPRLLDLRLVATADGLPAGADDPLRVDPTLTAWLLGSAAAPLRDPKVAKVVHAGAWDGRGWLDRPEDRADRTRLETLIGADAGHAGWIVVESRSAGLGRALAEDAAAAAAAGLLRVRLAALDDADAQGLEEQLVRLEWAARLLDLMPAIDAVGAEDVGRAAALIGRLDSAFANLRRPRLLITSNVALAVEGLPSGGYRLLRRSGGHAAPAAALVAAAREAGLALTEEDARSLAAEHPLPLEQLKSGLRLALASGARSEHPPAERRRAVAEAFRVAACPRLPHLATLLAPSYTLDDIILPPDRRHQLDSIVAQIRHSETVLEDWGFGRQLPYGRGVTALFSGPSGTGKTMAARAIGDALQRSVFAIDLSRLVSKYIGETEKNLDAALLEAQRAGAIVLFDEADALFAKRSEVKDSHDRYANMETAYLLQRMEAFDGLAILASNFSQNFDRAYLRRIAHVVEFPTPDAAARRRIWEQCLPAEAPRDPDLSFEFLSRNVEISGGNIRLITIQAAYAAATERCPIAMRHIVAALRAELVKLGMPGVARDLGQAA